MNAVSGKRQCSICGKELRADLIDSSICDFCYIKLYDKKNNTNISMPKTSNNTIKNSNPELLSVLCMLIGLFLIGFGIYMFVETPKIVGNLRIISLVSCLIGSVLFFSIARILYYLKELSNK